ncbi:MAG: sporulation protein YqfD [Clostridia bacterium]|nr:sporulation protein YqfD [Clostridia bacterium]
MPLIEYFRSPYRLSVLTDDARLILDFLIAHDIPFHGQKIHEDIFSVLLYTSDYKTYDQLRGKRRYRNESRKRLGFLALTARYRKRIGILVGFILAIALIIFSSLFVWDIRIQGADVIHEKVIAEALEERGLRLGTFIPSVDTEIMEQSLILDIKGLSLVSINLRGTVAYVEVRERADNTEIVDRQTPSNLIATADGQIEALQITGGVAAVKLGETVKKGDLLVSGIIDSSALGYRLVRARGEVLARTTKTYQAEIPYQTTEKVYTGRFFSQKSIKFFSKTIKLFRKDSISTSSCDKIESEKRIYLFGLIALPVFITETHYAEYEMLPKTLTAEEALQLAKKQLFDLRESELSDAEILGIHTSVSEEGDCLKIIQQVDCIMNITEEVKIQTE